MKKRILAIIRKEVIHILRDSRSLAIIFILPLLMVTLFGYCITFNVRNINIGVIDHDRSQASRDLIDVFKQSSIFSIKANPANRNEIEDLMMHRLVDAVLIIPFGYSKSLNTKLRTKVQILIDGTNANKASIVSNYVQSVIIDKSVNLNTKSVKIPVDIRTRIWYNPDLESTSYIVPGLIAVLMMMLCAMLTSITIAREKETGTMEELLVSPVCAKEIILGKVVPYIILAFILTVMVLILSKLIFQVPFRGRIVTFAGFSLVYLFASLSLGVLISSKVRSQQVAMMMALVGTLLPSILLSGFMFPIASMPRFLRLLSYLIPARYFLTIIRGVMLKGIGLKLLYPQGIILFVFGTLLLLISIKNFKTSLEA
jgi:ABC-2 type transport system permease protein